MFRIINIGVLSQNKFWGETDRMREDISSTCTLLEVGGKRIIVDPSPKRADLKRMLFNRAGLRPDAIDIVYVTHWHGDHLFGLRLFKDAIWTMAEPGLAEWYEKAPGYHHLHSTPPNPKTLRSDLPNDICEIILKCLKKKPKDRFQSADELLEEIRKFSND